MQARLDLAPVQLDRSVSGTLAERVFRQTSSPAEETLAVEEPLEIQLGFGPRENRSIKSISVTMRTPGHDVDLAAGFLMTEGVIQDVNDIERIGHPFLDGMISESVDTSNSATASAANAIVPATLPYRSRENMVRVELEESVTVSLSTLERNFYTTSSCGICGKASLLALQTVCPPRRENKFSIAAQVLYELPDRLRDAQAIFSRTGGLHGAGLFNAEGEMLSIREDVGRHNAVDKLLGAEFLADRTPLRNSVLLLSGRASFELLQKAVMGGIPMVASVGAPSSLAVQVAKEFDVTLVGFLRDDHFNIYHGANRIFMTGSAAGRATL